MLAVGISCLMTSLLGSALLGWLLLRARQQSLVDDLSVTTIIVLTIGCTLCSVGAMLGIIGTVMSRRYRIMSVIGGAIGLFAPMALLALSGPRVSY